LENKLIPYQAIKNISCTQAIVFAPHPDDEVFGCGGAIMRHVEQGIPVRVIIVSDGAFGVSEDKISEYALQRQHESTAAAHILGYGLPVFWHYPDRQLCYGEKLIQEILTVIRENSVDLVYAPSVFEMHPDHRTLGMAVVEAIRRIGKPVCLALYEVGMPLHPNQLLDISDLAARKTAAMECFASQNEKQRYDLHIAALNRYRTYTLPASVTAAEAYILVSAEELSHDPLKLYQSEYRRQKTLGLALDSSDMPLVSIIIRSMDRPTLYDALDSIALQTYPHIEVVIVNAKGANHRDVGEWCGRFPIRFIMSDGSLNRSHAANIGLNSATGNYLIFLDDDDLFYPDHIAGLVSALQKHPGIRCAYSGVQVEYYSNGQLESTAQFNEPFDQHRLWGRNFIPIHAMLFERSLVTTERCGFDETLEILEDWDFWIEISQHSKIVHIDTISAVYRNHGHSGMGFNHDESFLKESRGRLFDKWRMLLTGTQLDDLIEYRENLVTSVRHQLAEVWEHAANLQNHAADLQNRLTHKEHQSISLQNRLEQAEQNALASRRREQSLNKTIEELRHSTSWKITRPLRWFGLKINWLRMQKLKIQTLMKRHGNLSGIVDRAIFIAKQDGISTLVDTLIQFLNGKNENPISYSNDSYQQWITHYDTVTQQMRAQMRLRIDSFQHHPLISVIMPTYNSNPEWLTQAIESIRKQIYPHWELCIADDASTDNAIKTILQDYERKDRRIKVVYRPHHDQVSAACNSALEIAHGEWIALLDHEDLFSEHALFWVADAIQKKTDVSLMYSDEDKIDSNNIRSTPYFKCDWNQELFYAQNFMVHLSVYRATLLKKIGGFRTGFEGTQDYDLALRCIECISPDQIHHIPRILYHWRAHKNGAALPADTKPYAVPAGESALNEHLQRKKINATAEFTGHGYRVHYSLPDIPPLVTLIIPTRNGLQLIRQCVESILQKTEYPNYEILVIDNNSDDPATLQYLHELNADTRVCVIKDNRPFNFSALNNNAVKLAHGELIGLLNNDLEVISPAWLSEMIAIALQPRIGAVGAKLWYPNDTLQHGGVILGFGSIAGHAHKNISRDECGYFRRAMLSQNLSAVTAACLVIKKSIYEEVGGLDEQNLQVAFNDVDFCLRVREAGYNNVWTPYAELYHHESATRGYENTPEKRARFAKEVQYMQQRWGDSLFHDPAYSPNLTLAREDFSFANPPRVETL
jgi:glycosyltransferase involved in cell wall biosynthesis/LmbE family N-acetylglucosaminyl deacetylase